MKHLDTQLRKNSDEKTPSGVPRYIFRFGSEKQKFYLYKFRNHRTIVDPPECMIICFTLRDFLKTAKDVGLHISKQEKEQLKRFAEQ